MARKILHPPSAACLSASMRDIGYSLETAIADLVDNSISAGADKIDIICDITGHEPSMAIIDNGIGMDECELIVAMRHGAANPHQHRSPKDLGRFGLGLKTASFSQCRSLTVVSNKNKTLCAAQWDLDIIDAADDWLLSIFEKADIDELPYYCQPIKHGTVVLWRKLDRLMDHEIGKVSDEIVNEKLDIVRRHLALVFHRFLNGEVKGHTKISLTLNGHTLRAFDPFYRKNPATQTLPEEIVRIGKSDIRFQPYILPHHSRLSVTEYDNYQDRSEFISHQGCYVYRNGRLMAWGDWFRLVPKGEATKLARVQIDFPNSLDEEWTIDIKKSRARPPHIVRERLRQIISTVTSRSINVHRGRGQKLFQEMPTSFWERYADHQGIQYRLNAQHPLMISMSKKLQHTDAGLFPVFLKAIAASLPIEMIYSDYSTHPQEFTQTDVDENQSRKRLGELWYALYGDEPGDLTVFRQVVRSTNLFDDQQTLVDTFISEVLNDS